MKRILSLLLALAILITLLPQLTLPVNAATASGTCGDHLTWTLSGDTLTVSGEGPMYDYSAGSTWAPWWKYAEDITCIVIENGVTTIGNFAFWQNLYHVNSITIPDSVTYIGESAMCNFPFIRESKTFTIPAGVQSVAPQFLDSGFVEKIEDAIAWMDQAERRKYLINCPVDVEVYDADGNLVVQIIDDEVQDIEGGLAAYLDDDGQKVVVLPGDGEYEVKIIATDDGTVSCTVEEFASNDTMTRTVSYFDIAIEKDDVLYSTAAIPTEEEAATYPLTLPDGSIAEVSADQEPVTHRIELTAAGHGTASGPATKTEGEYIIVRAEPDENESFLWRAAGKPAPTTTDCTFTDVATGSFYYEAVLWAVENGITSGTGNGKFSPNSPCSRSEVVTFLWRAQDKPAPTGTACSFTDVNTSAFYYQAMLWAVENNITSGTGGNRFSPAAPCSRGQIVTFLYRTYH